MAIGRSFAESLQKALRGLETGLCGLDRVRELEGADPQVIENALAKAKPDRLRDDAEALPRGCAVERSTHVPGFAPRFPAPGQGIVHVEAKLRAHGLPQDAAGMRR